MSNPIYIRTPNGDTDDIYRYLIEVLSKHYSVHSGVLSTVETMFARAKSNDHMRERIAELEADLKHITKECAVKAYRCCELEAQIVSMGDDNAKTR